MTDSGAGGWRAPPEGLRRFEPGRDLRAVVELLEIGFQNELAARDRQWLAEMSALAGAGPLLSVIMRLYPPAASGLTGFVWYEDGRLVANASLMRASDDIWVVANVVTRPEYRQRGIGRRLMDAVVEAAHRRAARRLQLQVRHDNEAAQSLYDTMGFRRTSATTLLRLDAPGLAGRLGQPVTGAAVVTWGRDGTRRARRLLARSGSRGRIGPPGLLRAEIRRGLVVGPLEDRLRGRKRYRWALVAGGAYRGAAVAVAHDRTGPHQLELVSDPLWRGRVEPPLVDAAMIALARHAPHEVEAELDEGETGAIGARHAAGFESVRTLDRLVLDLDSLEAPPDGE